MDKFDVRRVAMGLTAYAIERQNGFERYQPEDSPPWQEQRRFWTDAILQGIAFFHKGISRPQIRHSR